MIADGESGGLFEGHSPIRMFAAAIREAREPLLIRDGQVVWKARRWRNGFSYSLSALDNSETPDSARLR